MRLWRGFVVAGLTLTLLSGGLASVSMPSAEAAAEFSSRTIPERPVFSEKMPGKVSKKAIQEVRWHVGEAYDEPMLAAAAQPKTVTIMGPAEASEDQMVQYIERMSPNAKLNTTVRGIVHDYYEEAGREGIRPDIALCQALKETGYFQYGGDVSPSQNNFCGLGATGNREPGLKFATPQLGVRAHVQHLLAYSSKSLPKEKIVDPRYQLIAQNRPDIYGKLVHWTDLNGVWAVPGTHYGQDILKIWQQAQAPDGSDAALAYAEKKISESPDDAGLYLYRGIVYMKRGDHDKALKDFDTSLDLKETPEGLYDRALVLTQSGKDKDALKAYNKLVKLQPDFTQGWYNRGMLELRAGKNKDAVRSLEKALELTPQLADARNAIGVAHVRQKKYDAAWKDFYEAANINSANWDVIRNQIIFEACTKP